MNHSAVPDNSRQDQVARGTSRWKAAGLILALLLLGGGVLAAATNNVDTKVTGDDEAAIQKIAEIGGKPGLPKDAAVGKPFDEQVALVQAIQDAVLTVAPEDVGIPESQDREPRDLVAARHGLCYDRSRVIEKMLTHVGLENRHASVYAVVNGSTVIGSIMTPRTPSHALTEVRTEKGWMVVDSNARWIGLTPDRRPVTLSDLSNRSELRSGAWDPSVKDPLNTLLRGEFVRIIGLYSRHGRFYPPFTPIPDVNWRQLTSNLTD